MSGADFDNVRDAALTLTAEERADLAAELLAHDRSDRHPKLPADPRVILRLMPDANNPTWVQFCRPVPPEHMTSVLGQMRRVVPSFKPIAWIKARLFDTHEELTQMGRNRPYGASNKDMAKIATARGIIKSVHVALARGDLKGLRTLGNAAKKTLRDSRFGERTDSERKYEKRPGAALVDCEYGGQSVLHYGEDLDGLGGFRSMYGMIVNSATTKVTREALESGDAGVVEFAEPAKGRGDAAQRSCQHLQLLYCVGRHGTEFDFMETLVGRGWGPRGSDEWWPQDSRIVSCANAVHEAAVAAGDTSPFRLSLEKSVEWGPEFEPIRQDLRKAIKAWLFTTGAGFGDAPTGESFEALMRACFKVLPDVDPNIVDQLFKGRLQRESRKRKTRKNRGGQVVVSESSNAG